MFSIMAPYFLALLTLLLPVLKSISVTSECRTSDCCDDLVSDGCSNLNIQCSEASVDKRKRERDVNLNAKHNRRGRNVCQCRLKQAKLRDFSQGEFVRKAKNGGGSWSLRRKRPASKGDDDFSSWKLGRAFLGGKRRKERNLLFICDFDVGKRLELPKYDSCTKLKECEVERTPGEREKVLVVGGIKRCGKEKEGKFIFGPEGE